MRKNICLAVMLAVLCGCVSFDYVGKREEPVKPASGIKLYNDSASIKRNYSVLGVATVSGNCQDVSRERMIEKLRNEAHDCGADAILIVEQQISTVGEDSGTQPFFTAFDYDDTNRSWSQIYRDVDQNFANTRRSVRQLSPGSARRIIRAEFLRWQ